MGTIICVDQGEEAKIRRYIIIDGQQRITTIFLLLKALYDASESESLKEEISDLLFNKDKYNDLSLRDQDRFKLKPIKVDNEQFALLMRDELGAMDKSSNIWRNYDYLKARAEKSSLSCKEILSGLKKLTAAVIVLDQKEDSPQVVFESINSTGLELSLADLIRNFILMTERDQERLFEQYWLKIEDNIKSADMPNFITDYLQFACREDIKAKNAYSQFKALFAAKNYTNEVMLKELLRYSGYYKAFLYGSDAYSAAVNRRLADIRSMDQSTIYPFLFYVFDDYREGAISEETLEKVLSFFVSYLLRYIVCGGSSNLLRGLFKTLYKRVFDSDEGKNDYYDAIVQFFWQLNTRSATPSDSMFKGALVNSDLYKNKKVCRFVLQAIESSTEAGEEAKESVDFSRLSIEHIMPQKLIASWKRELGEDCERVHAQYLHKLGNLSLTGYNSELGARPFEEKKQKIKACNSHIVQLNKDVLDKDVWNEDAIIARGERLSNLLLKRFKIEEPKGGLRLKPKDGHRVSFKISDNFDATRTRLVSCIFGGESIPASSYADLLSKMMQSFYERDSEKIESLAARDFKIKEHGRVYLTRNQACLRKPVQIRSTSIFYEANLSANTIVSFIRALMYECQIESDELVISVEGY